MRDVWAVRRRTKSAADQVAGEVVLDDAGLLKGNDAGGVFIQRRRAEVLGEGGGGGELAGATQCVEPAEGGFGVGEPGPGCGGFAAVGGGLGRG